ncbi:hypothetical protein NW754_014053 [Fusarium falciforme]|nr:hypothetical protein NW754_014053 [Fusarium falciforme]KAJ4202973.1 hypothetical protein NW767_005724 [Fusarium falciforme]
MYRSYHALRRLNLASLPRLSQPRRCRRGREVAHYMQVGRQLVTSPLFYDTSHQSLPRSHDESNPDSCNRQTALPLAQFSPKYIAKFPIKGLFHPQAKSLMSNSQMSGQPQHLTILLFLPTHAQLWLVEMREDSSLGLKTASR